jgi:D-alanine-D-alanine ligase
MPRIKIAVLAGGPSSEWEVSMRSGTEVLKHLPKEKYDAKLIQITKDGRWMLLDRKKALPLKLFGEDGRTAKSDLRKFDIAFIALHGAFGEDGTVQAILETIGLPYTGSGILASALGMNKLKATEVAKAAGLLTPKSLGISGTETKSEIKKNFKYPVVIKPNESGSSMGVSIVREEKELSIAILKALEDGGAAIAQQYIKGRELTCGVLGNTGSDLIALPPVEIISKNTFFDYEAKYTSKTTEEVCPAKLPKNLERAVQELAIRAHRAIGADGLTRSDFILLKDKFYFLEVNTSPGMTEASLCPKEAKAMGWEMGEFLDMIVRLALKS